MKKHLDISHVKSYVKILNVEKPENRNLEIYKSETFFSIKCFGWAMGIETFHGDTTS